MTVPRKCKMKTDLGKNSEGHYLTYMFRKWHWKKKDIEKENEKKIVRITESDKSVKKTVLKKKW